MCNAVQAHWRRGRKVGMLGLIGDVMKVRQKRMMQHKLQSVVSDRACRAQLLNFWSTAML